MTNETLEQENERLRKEVEDWTGMYHIAASRAESAESSEAKLLEALRSIQDSTLRSSAWHRIAAAAIQSAETRKK